MLLIPAWPSQAQLLTLSITATQGAASHKGMLMRIRVLTGAAAAAAQTGGSASAGNVSTSSATITTTVAGSLVYGGLGNSSSVATGEPGTTIVDAFNDTINGQWYGTFRTTSVTGTPGAVLTGSTIVDSFGSIAAQEILPAGTIAEDASAPGSQPYTTTAVKTLTSASFTPVPGSLIVVMIGCCGTAIGFQTCTVTDTGGGLTWIQMANTSGIGGSMYSGVWIADVPYLTPGPPPPYQSANSAIQTMASQ